MLKIAPSILAADALNLERDVRKVTEGGCDWLHVDVMDGHFVPNLAYTPDVVRRLKARFDVPLDVHLMMDDPEKFAGIFIKAGADILTVHAEAYTLFCHEPERIGYRLPDIRRLTSLLEWIRSQGVLSGLALKPATPVEDILPLLPHADLMLTMTVEPGFGGQKLNEAVIGKILDLRQRGYRGEIEADGGLTEDNLPELVRNGLSVAVMGTAVYREDHPGQIIRRLRLLADSGKEEAGEVTRNEP